jgi:Cu+-exporting ATPase
MYPILREALEAIADRRMTMELSMSIAIVAALAIGEFFTALVVILFVLIAEVLEGWTVRRGRKAIKDLLDFLPRRAVIRRDGESHEIDSVELQSWSKFGISWPTAAQSLWSATASMMLRP